MKKITTLLLVTLTVTLFTGCSNKSLENDRLVKQLNREQERTDEYKSQVSDLKLKNLQLQEQIDRLNSEISSYESKINNLDSSSSDQQQTINDLKKENEDLKNQLANSKTSTSSSASSGNVSYNTSSINDLRNQIAVLNADLSNYKAKCEILQQQLDSQIAINKNYSASSASNSYLSVKFWYDGNTYTSSKTTWYSDIACTKKITNDVILTSPIVDSIEQSNGYTAYCCMSTTGLVYCSSRPYLSVVKN